MGKRWQKSRKSVKDHSDRGGWKVDANGQNIVLVRENALFEQFYKAQDIVKPEEWSHFMETIKKDLPQSFRFVGCKMEGEFLMDILKERYFSKIHEIEIDGKKIETPTQLTWYPNGLGFQLSLPKYVLRKHSLLNNLHNFLVTESELGNLSRQETVSMIPPLLLEINSSHRIFDMCAAPGSKTAQLIEMLHSEDDLKVPTGFVLANDVNNKRCYLLVHQSLKRLNSPCCLVVNNDASAMPRPKILRDDDTIESMKFDRILCDAPCSGDGTMRKNFEIWKNWSPYHGYNLHRMQCRIAKRGLEMLHVGGLMVYSTCSLNPAENEATVAYLLAFSQGAVELVDVSEKLPGLKRLPGLSHWKSMDREGNFYDNISQVPNEKLRYFPDTIFSKDDEFVQNMHLERCMRILPHYQNTGGFFVALLKKTKEFPWVKEVVEKKLDLSTMHSIAALKSENLAESSVNDRTENSHHSPPRKMRKFQGFKEDPFVFLSADDRGWKAVEAHFDIAPGFPIRQLLRRGHHPDKKRNLYFVNDVIKRVIESSDDNIKIINAGIRLFSRIDTRESTSQIRLTQDGVNVLLPYIRRRLIEMSHQEMISMLTTSIQNCYQLKNFDESTRLKFDTCGEGSVVLICKMDHKDVAVCAWLGKNVVSPYLAKESTVHILRMLHYDTTNLENEMLNAKRKRNKEKEQNDSPKAAEIGQEIKKCENVALEAENFGKVPTSEEDDITSEEHAEILSVDDKLNP